MASGPLLAPFSSRTPDFEGSAVGHGLADLDPFLPWFFGSCSCSSDEFSRWFVQCITRRFVSTLLAGSFFSFLRNLDRNSFEELGSNVTSAHFGVVDFWRPPAVAGDCPIAYGSLPLLGGGGFFLYAYVTSNSKRILNLYFLDDNGGSLLAYQERFVCVCI